MEVQSISVNLLIYGTQKSVTKLGEVGKGENRDVAKLSALDFTTN